MSWEGQHIARECRCESGKEETVNLIEQVAKESRIFLMTCSSGAEHKENLASLLSSKER